MATILFTWELGAGFGHLNRHTRIIHALVTAGHEIFFAARDPGNAERILGAEKIKLLQAPLLPHSISNPIQHTRSYADILHNTGFNEMTALAGRIKAWRQLYEYIKPDLIIYDHSPTAKLAFSQKPVRHILCGSGFTVPPPSLPNIRDWEDIDQTQLEKDKQQILDTANSALETVGSKPLRSLSELLQCDARLLLTFKELDHYPLRQGDEHLGVSLPEDAGAKPRWPAGSGKKIFAYLHPFKAFPEFIQELAACRASTIIYAPEVQQSIKNDCKCSHIQFVQEQQRITDVTTQCDLVITNGTHATTAAALLAGKPVLLLPKTPEQLLLSRRIREYGAGLMVPQFKPAAVENKLTRLLDSGDHVKAAEEFARNYQNFTQEQQTQRIMEIIHDCLETAS